MRPLQRAAGLCLMAATFVYSPLSLAENRNFFDEIYLTADANAGRSAGEYDTYGPGVGIGFTLPKNFFVQADYNYLEFDEIDDNTHLVKVIGGIQHALNNNITTHFGAGGYYAEDTESDENGDGVVLSAGMTIGGSKLSALLHVDYLNDTDGNENYLFGVGIRWYPGGHRPIVMHRESKPSSLGKTTACEDRYGELFPLCKEQSGKR